MEGLLALLMALTVTSVLGETPMFRSDAVQHIKTGFKAVRRTRKDFTKIEIVAVPGKMVEKPEGFDTNRVTVEIKAGSGEWAVVEEEPSLRGGKYRWTVEDVAPCVDHAVRLWLHGKDGGQAVFEFPNVVHRATTQELVAAQFTPAPPTDLRVEEVGEDSVEVSWELSTCAEMYDVTYERLSGGEETFSQQVEGGRVVLSGLHSCSEYEVRVTAVLGHEFSEEATVLVFTSPGYYAAEKLTPTITSTTNSVTAKWRAFEKLSCIRRYSVTICKEGRACPEGKEVARDDAMSQMTFSSDNTLDQCSDYTLHIKPIFNGEFLDERIVEFRTKSQPVGNVAELLTSVEAEAGEEQMITVRWDAIQCASKFDVFQKMNTNEAEWEKIGTSKETTFETKGAPCMEYRYGVKVTIDDQESEIVEFDEAVMTKMDTSVPYVAPNLDIKPTSDGAHLSWDHGQCIKSYKIRTCETYDTCFEDVVIIEDPTMYKMAHTIKNLNSCSMHHLEIYPMTSEDTELAASPRAFTTSSPTPSPPQELMVALNKETNKVDIEWTRVQCAQGYRIYQNIAESETETKWDSEDLSVSLESPEPCKTYSYGVAAIIGDEESEPTAFQEVHIPPRMAEYPLMFIEEKSNGSVTFILSSAATNHHCKVGQYEVRSGEREQVYEADGLEGGRITLEVGEEEASIEARLRYTDLDAWTPWVSSDSPRQEALGAEMDFLLLIVIGAVVACALPVILVITCIIKQRNAKRKYDAEKAEGNSDESKRLNAPVHCNEPSEEKVIKS